MFSLIIFRKRPLNSFKPQLERDLEGIARLKLENNITLCCDTGRDAGAACTSIPRRRQQREYVLLFLPLTLGNSEQNEEEKERERERGKSAYSLLFAQVVFTHIPCAIIFILEEQELKNISVLTKKPSHIAKTKLLDHEHFRSSKF